jgi:hypothetical protein
VLSHYYIINELIFQENIYHMQLNCLIFPSPKNVDISEIKVMYQYDLASDYPYTKKSQST